MQVSSKPRSASRTESRDLADALQLIAYGTADEKVRFIAARDPDWFIHNLLAKLPSAAIEGEQPAPATPISRQLLDQTIARLTLRGETPPRQPGMRLAAA